MKKSVILIILVVYIISIVVVGYFGIKMKTYDEIVYAEKIEIFHNNTSVDELLLNKDPSVEINDAGITTIRIPFNEESNEAIKYQIDYRVLPNDVSNKTVKFIADTTNPDYVIDLTTGIITIYKPWVSITVKIETNDGSKLSTTVEVLVVPDYLLNY